MNEENDIQQEEVSDAAWQLAQSFHELMEECAPDFPEEVSEQIVRLSNQISQVETKQQQSLYGLESVKQQLDDLTSTNKLLENAGKANQLLGQEHYAQHIVEPMVRSLFPVFDIIADSRNHHGHCGCNATGLMDSIYSQLLQFLANYGVEIFEHTTADSYDREIMKPIKWETTSQEHLENSIAQSLQAGFRLGQTRILRMETVSLYKHQPSKTNTNILIERVEK